MDLYDAFIKPVRHTGETPIMKAALLLMAVVVLLLGGAYGFNQMTKNSTVEAAKPDTVIEANAAPEAVVAETEEAPPVEEDNSVVYTDAARRDFDLVKREIEYACKDNDRVACPETCKAMQKRLPDTMRQVAVPANACLGVPGINHRPKGPDVDDTTTKAVIPEEAVVVK